MKNLNHRQIWEQLLAGRSIQKNGCWHFYSIKGTLTTRIYFLKKGRRISRVAAHIFHGMDINNRKIYACHHCDNPFCFCPEHIFIGTQLENMRDMMRKGRKIYPIGKDNPHYGRRKSDAQRAKQSLAMMGKPGPRKGVKLSPATKAKISAIHKGGHHSYLHKIKLSLACRYSWWFKKIVCLP